MVIGGIGYCDIQGKFQFHKNILEGLQIYNESLLYGVFHPKPKNPKSIDNIKYHYMITPIPHKVWPRTARFIFRLKHKKLNSYKTIHGQTEGIQQISAFLADIGVAIIYSFSNRSAHRYSTWDVHVCFDKYFPKDKLDYKELINKSEDYLKEKLGNLKPENLDSFSNQDLKGSYEGKKSYYREVYIMAKWVEILIKRKFKRVLFEDKNDVDLTNSVVTRVNTSCHYFYYESERLKKKHKELKEVYSHFTCRYSNGKLTPHSGLNACEIIELCDPVKAKEGFQLPSICFVEADSHYLNLRLIVIPNEFKHRFFKLSVFHQRISERTDMNNTSKGLLNIISLQFQSPQYTIWKSSIQLFDDHQDGEKSYCNGKLSLFIEVNRKVLEKDADTVKNELENTLNELDLKNKSTYEEGHVYDLSHVKILAKCERVYPQLLRRYFKIPEGDLSLKKNLIEIRRKIKYDVFLSYAYKDRDRAEKLIEIFNRYKVNYFSYKHPIKFGNDFANEILEAIYTSREFCLLVTKNTQSSPWVTSEWGAAWSLNIRPFTPVFIGEKIEEMEKALDSRISKYSSIKWKPGKNDNLIENYAEEIFYNRFKNELDYEYEYSKPISLHKH